MAMEISNNYNYATQSIMESNTANSTKKKETEKITETAGSSKAKQTTDYANRLAKLVPSADFRIGNACSSAKSGKSLTVNPKLLEKMQNDPEKEKDMKDLIKGVEFMTKLSESIAKASGWTIVYQHSYIDENGKYYLRMQTRNDGMLKLSDKLRKERQENSEKLIEKSKEKAVEKREALQEALEDNKTETEDKKTDGEQENSGVVIVKNDTPLEKAEQMLLEKINHSENDEIYLDDNDMQAIIKAAKEDAKEQPNKAKTPHAAGGNFDMQI